jgi:hypothetical protein
MMGEFIDARVKNIPGLFFQSILCDKAQIRVRNGINSANYAT